MSGNHNCQFFTVNLSVHLSLHKHTFYTNLVIWPVKTVLAMKPRQWGSDRRLLLIIERGGAGLQCGVKRLGFNERARKRICSHKRRGKEKDVEKDAEKEEEKSSMWW